MSGCRRAALPLLAALAACDPGTTRPQFLPSPRAPAATVLAPRPRLVPALSAWFDSAGVHLVRQSVRDGYVETAWHPTPPDDPVKVRVWVEPGAPGRSRVVVEAVHRPLLDPSLPPRLEERLVPPRHPGAALVRDLLAAMRERFGGEDDAGPPGGVPR